jgi:class 3 adenylate cyclase
VRLLNGYFDCLVSPIRENGGYVLKFIGAGHYALARRNRIAALPPTLLLSAG